MASALAIRLRYFEGAELGSAYEIFFLVSLLVLIFFFSIEFHLASFFFYFAFVITTAYAW